jgi:hypothetical protein
VIGQIPAKSFLPQVSSRDIVAGLFSNRLALLVLSTCINIF